LGIVEQRILDGIGKAMRINPLYITVNGRTYACFHSPGYAYKWAQKLQFARHMAVKVNGLTGFLLPRNIGAI
jgi:hypothetical protein